MFLGCVALGSLRQALIRHVSGVGFAISTISIPQALGFGLSG